MLKWLLIGAALTIPLHCQPAKASSNEDRLILASLYAMKEVCGMENGTSAKWVGHNLMLINARTGWSMDQMLAIAADGGAPLVVSWRQQHRLPKVKAARDDYCAKMRNLKRATEALF
jgi:hypothetical protein